MQSTITLEGGKEQQAAGRRTVYRTVWHPYRTGHTASTWVGSPKYQWAGVIKLSGGLFKVYGYSDYDDLTPPTEWSDDTY